MGFKQIDLKNKKSRGTNDQTKRTLKTKILFYFSVPRTVSFHPSVCHAIKECKVMPVDALIKHAQIFLFINNSSDRFIIPIISTLQFSHSKFSVRWVRTTLCLITTIIEELLGVESSG
jgi:hypothetical protein